MVHVVLEATLIRAVLLWKVLRTREIKGGTISVSNHNHRFLTWSRTTVAKGSRGICMRTFDCETLEGRRPKHHGKRNGDAPSEQHASADTSIARAGACKALHFQKWGQPIHGSSAQLG